MRNALLLVALLVASCAPATDALAPGVNDARMADVRAALQKEWPDNRIINIVAFGHSVPAGYTEPPQVRPFDSYPYLLREALWKKYPTAVVNVIVSAVGGEASRTGARRFERDALAYHPDVILIDYALNDRGLGPDKARDALRSMVRAGTASGAAVLLLTPTGDTTAHRSDPNDPLNVQAAMIRELAREEHVGLVDTLAHFGTDPALMVTKNHPSRRGHEIVVRELMRWF